MNEREKFLKSMQSFVATYIDRVQTMSEAQVIKALHALQAARNSEGDTLNFLNSIALAPTEDPEDEINKLRSQLSSAARPTFSQFYLSDYFVDALKKRLETLRKNGK